MATRACGRHLFAFNGDSDIFLAHVEIILKWVPKDELFKKNIQDLIEDDLSKRKCLNLNINRFQYNNCSFNSSFSLISLVYFFSKFIHIFAQFEYN